VKRFLRFLLGLSVATKIIIAVVAVGLGVFVFAYFEPYKLFIDEVVDEDFPAPVAVVTTTTTDAPVVTEAPTSTTAVTTTTAAAQTPGTTASRTQDEQEQTPVTTEAQEEATTTTVAPTTTTTTTAPPATTTTTVPAGPVLLSRSEWISLGHPGTGTVLVYRQPDGSHVVRFEDLEVSNGPDLLVILSASPLVDDRGAYSATEYVSLGDLKGNKGNQNYMVPAEINLDDYMTVAIWCRRFNYTFNAADIHFPPS
jgi:hypothetical protein